MGDDRLAAAADRCEESDAARAAYADAYAAAAGRLPAIVTDVARDPLFHEAVIWQNPALAGNWLQKLSPETRRTRKERVRELAVASYLQRYCLKNETIGFFGPIGWATLSDTGAFHSAPGERLLSRRTTYFETWAIEDVARMLAERGSVARWLRPRRDPTVRLVGNSLHRTDRKPTALSPAQMRMFVRCDGHRTVEELLATPDPEAPTLLGELCELGVVAIGLPVPIQTWPERWLRHEIERIDDSAVRAAALEPLDELIRVRDRVAAAAGDPAGLQPAMDALAATFTRITGRPASQRAGEPYAGRTLVYEDTIRDVEVRIGRAVVDQLAAPLRVVLDSARWLIAEITDEYRSYFADLVRRECRRTGTDHVPLLRLLRLAGRAIMPLPDEPTPAVGRAVARFQERWGKVLDGSRTVGWRRSIDTAELVERVAELFPARPLAWSCATQCSPDVLIAAASPDAIGRGDFLLVLGELHLACNTMESRCFVEQHPCPATLMDAARAHHGARRVVAIPRKSSPYVTTRLSPPTAVLSPEYTYWSGGDEAIVPPEASVLLAANDLVVGGTGDDLVVRSASTGAEFAFFEVIGDLMSAVTANAFRPVSAAAHRPRITIDRLVLARESWTFAVSDLSWAFVKDESARFALARQWRHRHEIPERAFYRVPVEIKPSAVDFRSLLLVNLFAKAVRRTSEVGRTSVTVSEMLPDLDQLWLTDAAGERYACELRMVATLADPFFT